MKKINSVTEEQQLLAACACAEKQILLLSQANYNVDDDEDNLKWVQERPNRYNYKYHLFVVCDKLCYFVVKFFH